jgi:CRISPR-associated protein Cas2
MFVIITYDVDEKRVSKVHKVLKRYLVWTQNSVFEGEITPGVLKKCLADLRMVTNSQVDSIYVYQVPNKRNIKKVIYGQEKNLDDLFL